MVKQSEFVAIISGTIGLEAIMVENLSSFWGIQNMKMFQGV